jgi:hypothetical protein
MIRARQARRDALPTCPAADPQQIAQESPRASGFPRIPAPAGIDRLPSHELARMAWPRSRHRRRCRRDGNQTEGNAIRVSFSLDGNGTPRSPGDRDRLRLHGVSSELRRLRRAIRTRRTNRAAMLVPAGSPEARLGATAGRFRLVAEAVGQLDEKLDREAVSTRRAFWASSATRR